MQNEMMFKRYSSIERDKKIFGDSYSKFMEHLMTHGFSDVMCIAQQKVHGANFGITINDEGHKANKRGSFLSLGEGFSGNFWVELTHETEPKLRTIYNELKVEFPSMVQAKFACELAGGTYDGKSTTKVQGGTNYAVEQFFYFFDIQMFFEDEDGLKAITVNPLKSEELFAKNSVYHAKSLECTIEGEYFGKKIAPLTTWIKHDKYVNHVSIELSGKELSAAEGIVIKAVEDGRTYCGSNRIIIKRINPLFKEAQKGAKKKLKKSNDTPAEAIDFIAKAQACVVEMRLDKVCGNHGFSPDTFDSKNDFGKLQNLVVMDIIEDLQKDGEKFDPTWMKTVKSKLMPSIAKLIVTKFIKKTFD